MFLRGSRQAGVIRRGVVCSRLQRDADCRLWKKLEHTSERFYRAGPELSFLVFQPELVKTYRLRTSPPLLAVSIPASSVPHPAPLLQALYPLMGTISASARGPPSQP
ncbi:hypothetical protein F2P79_022650 [Pimephales promelas]|nr:hypothetical protein F2P79_022650 [Pimephales promelas]